ncbi:N-acetyltransferase [Enterococcus devriesei]|uniref:GNAT family N-acetyltransferase n=1 Tax=Enterococcus devriesei TaxID=319970 RepID=UPI001C10CCE4|nr:N-acetyltransferase [Enterococcus devriesei]MBU5366293.1 GNAT family N-acetyltransferase [Enterococcus devriesei]MDT2821591.1 N-acetyltransferase [Enterococcus devriesei]
MTGMIRPCSLEDLTELQAISRETFKETFAADNDPADLEEYLAAAYNVEKLQRELKQPESRFYFIYLAEQVAGYLKLNTGDAQTEAIDPKGLEVERIYIRKAFKRQGLGRQLLDYAFELAVQESRASIWLGVWEDNQNALKFYHSFGFKQVGAHDFYVGTDKQTDLLMRKSLL